ncbi:MAG: DUF6240 domain-containing protein, partial [Clostridiales bacterium]|nr:DUF6240 domain-containing protein [Clostridiales bacterium]
LLKTLPDSVDRKKVLDKASSNLSRGIPLASIDLEFKGEKTAIAAGQPAISTKTNASTPVSIFGRSVIMGNAKSTPASDGYKRLHSFRPLSKPMAASITDALSKYESNQTEILPEYGDSFEKAKGHIGNALLGMGYDATEENKKAAEILARNEAEITLENLEAAKELNAKVSRLSSELHPRIALKMIKEGASPLSLHVDDALRYIDKNRESYGGDYGDKIAALVLEMDRANELDPETRESVIGIYRMLSVIEKNGGAALGAALKSNASHTLGSLYDLAKSMDKSVRLQAYDGIENKVSEATDNSVRSVFERAEELKFKSNRDTLNVLINRASSFPEAIKKNPAVLELPLEELANLLPSSDISRLNRAASLLKSLSRTRPETIAWMRANGLPATLGNLMGLRMLGESFFYPLDSLGEECQGLEDLDPEEALDRIEERLSAKRDTARGDELEKAVNALNALRTSRKLEREDRFLSKSLTPVSVFYNSKDGTQAVITIGATLGVVQANAEANGDQIDLSVKLESGDKLEVVRERMKEVHNIGELKGLEKGIPKNMLKDMVPGLRDKAIK